MNAPAARTVPPAGGVRVIDATGVPVRPLALAQASPETDAEKTQPLPPMTGMALLRQAVLMRGADWWRGDPLTKVLLGAVLVAVVALQLRDHDDPTVGPAPAPAAGSTASHSTATDLEVSRSE